MSAKLTKAAGPGRASLQRLASMSGKRLQVGCMGPGGGPSPLYIDTDGMPGLPVATILSFHEFGRGVPQRSIIRATMASHRRELAERTETAIARVAGGVSPDRALEQVGRWLAGQFQRRIDEGLQPALSQATLDATPYRRSAKPLDNTGQLRQLLGSIRWVTV